MNQFFNLKSATSQQLPKNSLRFKDFTTKIPKNGGIISVDDHQFNKLLLVHTCTIDYFLLAIWCIFKIKPSFPDIIKENILYKNLFYYLNKVLDYIENDQWDKAKSLWILDVIKLKPNDNFTFSTYKDEFLFFLKHFQGYQALEYFCQKCKKKVGTDFELLYLQKHESLTFLTYKETIICSKCKSGIRPTFIKIPQFVFVQTISVDILLPNIPLNITIGNHSFNFLCCTFNDMNYHFKSIFCKNEAFFAIDNEVNSYEQKVNQDHFISSIFYYLI